MSIYSHIRAALEKKLSTTANLPSIAYENVLFDPTTGISFLKVAFVPVSRKPAVRGLNPQQRYDGIFRVFCYTPEGSGPAAADTLAKTVIDAFDATTDISFTPAGGTQIIVSVDYAERDNGFVDSPWYYVSVDIGWYIYSQ
jgi:hypothetical protein